MQEEAGRREAGEGWWWWWCGRFAFTVTVQHLTVTEAQQVSAVRPTTTKIDQQGESFRELILPRLQWRTVTELM